MFQTWNVPKVPERTDTVTEMATFGVTLDGIKLERDTAESFRDECEWRYEAITAGLARRQTDGACFTWLCTDCNNAHVQPTGAYHYYITDDYPYIPRCVFGTPDGSFRVRR